LDIFKFVGDQCNALVSLRVKTETPRYETALLLPATFLLGRQFQTKFKTLIWISLFLKWTVT